MAGVFTRLFTVMLIGMMCSILCNVIDSAITGQFLGRDAVAAVGLTGPIISLIGLVNALFVAGTGQLCTESMGKADIGRVNQIFSTTVVSVIGFGCLMTAFFADVPAAHRQRGGSTGDEDGRGLSQGLFVYHHSHESVFSAEQSVCAGQ